MNKAGFPKLGKIIILKMPWTEPEKTNMKTTYKHLKTLNKIGNKQFTYSQEPLSYERQISKNRSNL